MSVSGSIMSSEKLDPEYRVHDPNLTMPTPENPVSQLNLEPTRRSYADTITQNMFPKKDQAIVMESREGISIKEYATAIGNIIGPNAIRFISRISNARVCVYLDSKKTVTDLTGKFNSITINVGCR